METRRERFFLRNTLSGLAKSFENQYLLVELRNESYVHGQIVQVDGFMNIVMKDCVFQHPNNQQVSFQDFFVQARNIRYIHLPENTNVQQKLETFNNSYGRKQKLDLSKTNRQRKLHKQYSETMRNIAKF